jgi:DNA primase
LEVDGAAGVGVDLAKVVEDVGEFCLGLLFEDLFDDPLKLVRVDGGLTICVFEKDLFHFGPDFVTDCGVIDLLH